MRWILSFCMPPLAVLASGRTFHAMLNVILCLCGYLPGVLHALLITTDAKTAESRERLNEARRSEEHYANHHHTNCNCHHHPRY